MSASDYLTFRQRRFLKHLFGGEDCLLAPEERKVFDSDASRLAGLAWAVVRPRKAEQVADLLRWAQKEHMPIYPRARATGSVGGAVPRGGIVVSMLRMNAIKEINPDDFVAVVEPGVVTGELQREARAKGLYYPPDPASANISSVGGNVATGAGGLAAVKYGTTRDYVLGVQAALPGGKLVRLGGRTHKNVVGLDLARLFVGSEGTLGITTELTLKLLPKPEATRSVLAAFPDLDICLEAARRVFASGSLPSAMEFMDSPTIEAIDRMHRLGWRCVAGAALLFRLDGSHAALEREASRMELLLKDAGAVHIESGQGEDEERLWEFRRLISPAMYRMGPDKAAEDVTVPRGRIKEAVAGYKKIGEEYGVTVHTFGHLGDGNIHVDMMYDRSVPGEQAKIKAVVDKVFRHTLSLGGTMSGEHGVGLTKLPWLDLQLSKDERALMHAVKAAFDPTGIMNPGKGY